MLCAIQAGNITEIRYYNFQPHWALLYSGSLLNFNQAYDLIEMGFMMVKFGMLSCYSRCCVVLYKLISGIRKKSCLVVKHPPVHLFTLARQVSSNYGASCKLPYPWMVFPHHIFTNIPLLVYLYLIYSEKKNFKLPQTMLYLFDIVKPKTKKIDRKNKKMPQTMLYWITHQSNSWITVTYW